MILLKNFGGGDHGSASLTKQRICSMLCGLGKDAVTTYLTAWRGALRRLDGTPWDFTAFDCVRTFVDNLPMTDAYRSLWEHIDNSFSTVPPVFPDFEDIANAVYAVDIQQHQLQSLCPAALPPRKPPNPHPPSSSALPDSTSSTAPPARLRPTCTNCKALGHSVEACWEPGGGNVGGRDRFYAERLAAATRPHANFASDSLIDPSSTTASPLPTVNTPVIEPTPDVAHTPVSDDVAESSLLDLYAGFTPESLPPYLAFLQSTDSFALASFASRFNTILDSGCTTHIIKDRQYFWTYNPELATPVGTANCGVLNTLARGEVRFRVLFQGQERIVRMRECLHAPDVPVNLLSVGAMAEKSVHVIFEKGAMTIHFPHSSVDVDGVSLSAVVAHRLSFLRCDFLLPPSSSVPDALLADILAFPAMSDSTPPLFFPHTPVDSELWHRHFGHLGMDATRDVLTKPYAKGVSFDGTISHSIAFPVSLGSTHSNLTTTLVTVHPKSVNCYILTLAACSLSVFPRAL